MSDLLKKLNWKNQQKLVVLNHPTGFEAALAEMRGCLAIETALPPGDQRCPFILAFVESKAELDKLAGPVLAALEDDGLLWWAYPKKTSKRYKTDLTRDAGWDSMTAVGYRHVRMIAWDDDWSMVRQRHESKVKA